ncbi:MAG: hypothetical protein KJ626_01175 [Verrucomicrobia bacterium]|nr:hypothetical protein [Verrucomicrobiota bacterium]
MNMRMFVVLAVSFLLSVTVYSATFYVENNNDSGAGSLRQAIVDANSAAGADTVEFHLEPHEFTITITGHTMNVLGELHIDGKTATNYTGTPLINLVGDNPLAHGVYVTTGPATIEALRITGFDRGVYLADDHCVVKGCYIMSNASIGVFVTDWGCTIGGTGWHERNVISGNENGIFFQGATFGAEVLNNYIGVDPTGTFPISNTFAGVYLTSWGTRVGGTNASERNIISGNGTGIEVSGLSRDNLVINNYIGTDYTGSNAVPNNTGILASGTNNTIGGSSSALRNVISGNRTSGIEIRNGGRDNTIIGNYIGVDVTGLAALPNYTGIKLHDSPANFIGGLTANERNIISGNSQDGVDVALTGSVGNVIQGNYIGVGKDGSTPLGGAGGVDINSAADTIVGRSATGKGNVISACARGIRISGALTRGTIIRGNMIGTDANGMVGIPNNTGIEVSGSPDIRIGGSGSGERNVISGNGGNGIDIRGAHSHDIEIINNYIGVDATGLAILSNSWQGIFMSDAPSNTIGRGGMDEGNVISGNGTSGIYIYGDTAVGNHVEGNFIGTDRLGLNALPNGERGVELEAPDNNIGSSLSGGGNIISGNNGDGIYMYGAYCHDNSISGNKIGVGLSTNCLPNGFYGISVWGSASNNIIGGNSSPGENIIACNPADGIFVDSGGRGILVGRNSFWGNGELAIDLSPGGINPNDDKDPDTGANNMQNYPVLLSVTNDDPSNALRVSGTLNSTPDTDFYIVYFCDYGPDHSGHGEGLVSIPITMAVTDSGGNASWLHSFETPDPTPNFVSAIAVDSNTWDTSEMSYRVMIDSDGDGMPDGWEEKHWGHYKGEEPYVDSDNDGLFNIDEWNAETDPTNNASRLEIAAITGGNDTGVVVHVDTSLYRRYRAQGCLQENYPNWDITYTSSGDGTGGRIGLVDYLYFITNAAFYRVEAWVP